MRQVRVKNSKKTILFTIVGVLAVLYVCYLIGQNVVLPKRMAKEGYLDENGNIPEYSILQDFANYELVGERDLDVPGGKTINKLKIGEDSDVEDSWRGSYIFMMPGTSMAKAIKFVPSYKKLSFYCGIHPWIQKDITDGARLTIIIYSEDKEHAEIEEQVQVDAEEMKKVVIDLANVKGKSATLEISCDGGNAGDESGDWVLLEYPVVD